MRSLIVLALIALLVAGCSSKAPGQVAAGTNSAATTPVSNALQPLKTNATHALVTRSLVVDGQTRTGGCIITPAATRCEYPLPGHDDYKLLDIKGNATLLNGTLSWTAATPGTANMNAYILFQQADGYYWTSDSPTVSGPSPLAISFDLSAFAGKGMAIGFSTTNGAGDAGVYAAENLQQDFHFAGAYSYTT